MALPQHLDTFITDKFVITPQIAINRATFDHEIHVTVFARDSNTIVATHVVHSEHDYRAFVDGFLGDK